MRNSSCETAGARRAGTPERRGNGGAGLVALIALVAAGCGPSTWYPEPLRPLYDRDSLPQAAKDGPVPTIVRGNPFGGAQGAFAATVAGLMKGQHFGPPVTFAPRDISAARAGYRVIMLFDAGYATGTEGLCGNPAEIPIAPSAAAAAPGGARSVAIAAAFCVSNRLMTTVHGRADATGPDDAMFQALVRQVTRDLFPPFNNELNGKDGIKTALLR